MDVDLSLLSDLVLGDHVQISKALVQECRNIIRFLENLRVNIVVYELEKFFKNSLYISYLIQIASDERHFGQEFLFFFLVALLEFKLDFLLFVF